jgi:two-component system LytT family response regulator
VFASKEGCNLKVVIIDDEKAMHFIMKRMLAKVDGIEIVESFQETATAYLYLVNHEVGLIFLDIRMPRENGLEFAKRLIGSGRRMKLVFVTCIKNLSRMHSK